MSCNSTPKNYYMIETLMEMFHKWLDVKGMKIMPFPFVSILKKIMTFQLGRYFNPRRLE